MVEAAAASKAATSLAAASPDKASPDKASPDKAPMDTGSGAATGTATTMDMATGTESLPVTLSALSSASV
jgi:hypothetical protein